MYLHKVLCAACTICCLPVVAQAATQFLNYIVENPNSTSGDYFGISADIYGTTAIIGATANDLGGGNAGAAYIYDTRSGQLLHTLTNPLPRSRDLYGAAVGIGNNFAVVGSHQDDTQSINSGIAFVYDTLTGGLVHQLSSPEPESSDNFGVSVSVFGGRAAIGAHRDNGIVRSSGAVHIYDLETGDLINTLRNPAGLTGDQFGISVSISGNIAVVGANRTDQRVSEDVINRNVGTAYVFNIATGELLHTLDNPTPARGDQFGGAVATNGSVAVIGAVRDDEDASNTGKAYVFDVSTGELVSTISNPTPDRSDLFGDMIDISGDTVLIGATKDDLGANNTGAAHLFDLSTGALLQTFANPTPNSGDLFGGALAIYEGNILIGSARDDSDARDSGAVFFYSDYVEGQEPAPVPLPGSLALALIGLSSLAGARLKKKVV